jgi:AraC-like DNA-binding protein
MLEVFETADVEAAAHLLSSAYGSMRIAARGERQGIRLTQMSAGRVRLDHNKFAMRFDIDASALDVLVFGELKAGLVRFGSDRDDRYYRPGQVFFSAQPEHPYTATMDGTEVELVIIDPTLPSQVANAAPGRAPQPVRFTGHEAVSANAARQWRATYAHVRATLLAQPDDAAAQPLFASSAARLLVAVALATFPNNAVTDPTAEDRRDAHPATLRRAVAFIDEHAHEDISIADIAAAAHVTIRAVQLAFRRHMDTTPTQYLRRVRLAHAHRDLTMGDPERESVTAVAVRWGFAGASRFAAQYRQAYGALPSHTLRQN